MIAYAVIPKHWGKITGYGGTILTIRGSCLTVYVKKMLLLTLYIFLTSAPLWFGHSLLH